MWNRSKVNATRLHWWLVNIGLVNGLAQSDNKPILNNFILPYGVIRPTGIKDKQNNMCYMLYLSSITKDLCTCCGFRRALAWFDSDRFYQYPSWLLHCHRHTIALISQIPKCTSPTSHNAPICNRNVDICALICYKMVHSKIQRFKIALLLPIKHRIIYITVISTWNVNTSTNTAVHYHGSKGSWKSCGIYGLLVCYTYSKYISTGLQRVQQNKRKKSNTKWHYQ